MILARLSLLLALIAYGSSNSMSGTFQTLHLECTSKPEEVNSEITKLKNSIKESDATVKKLQSRIDQLERESNATNLAELKAEVGNYSDLADKISRLENIIQTLIPAPSTPEPSTPVSNAPVPSTPVSNTPVPSTPVPSTPVSSTPVSSTPEPSTPVPSTPVSSTPVSSTPLSRTSAPSTSAPATTLNGEDKDMESLKNCKEILDNDPTSSDGVYTININPSTTINVYCEMNEGGWTVFQKRFDGSEDFRRNFKEYSEGFGDPSQEQWLGLNNIHQLTSQPGYKSWILRVDLESFKGETAYAQYEDFNVGAGTDYTLSIGSYSGTAGNSMRNNNGARFTTYDRDQDEYSGNCADRSNGAWWFSGGCGHSNLNADTYNDNRQYKGMFWYHWKYSWGMPMKSTTMKMKPIM